MAIANSKIDTVIIDYSLIIIINVNYNLFNFIWQTHFSSCIFAYFGSMEPLAFAPVSVTGLFALYAYAVVVAVDVAVVVVVSYF